jgi:hypothetical protein
MQGTWRGGDGSEGARDTDHLRNTGKTGRGSATYRGKDCMMKGRFQKKIMS